MKNHLRCALALATLLFAAGPASAGGGTIDATQYVPLGAFNAWEMIDKITWEDTGTKVEHQVISVTKADVVDGVPRYNIRTKLFQDVPDVLFQFGVEGDTLYLYGVRVLLPTQFIDDDDVDVKLPTIFFDPKVPVGNTATPLDVDFAETPVTSKFKVKLKLGPLDESGNVFLETGSTVTARWESVAPIDTPLGSFSEGGGPLARLVLEFFFLYSSDNDDINDEIEDEVTQKAVSGVMGPGLGFIEIDGQGQQKKILNRAVLAGELVFNPADLDSFPPLPPFDVNTIEVPFEDGTVYILRFLGGGEGDFGDGLVSLSDVDLTHNLGGRIQLNTTATAGSESADVTMTGKLKLNKKTGLIKVSLKGKTKQLPGLAKVVKFNVKQDLDPNAEGGPVLDVVYNAGKDPITKELITGTMQVPVSLFESGSALVDLNLPVDVPKIKQAQFLVNPLKRTLGCEGTITLQPAAGEGGGLVYPITVRQAAKVKEGFPTARTYSMIQTGTKAKLFKFKAVSDESSLALVKLAGKVAGAKVKPDLGALVVTPQP